MIFSRIVQIRSVFDFDLRCSSCMGNDNEDALHRHLKGTSESGFRPSGLNCLRLVCMLHRPFPVNVAEPKSVTFSLMSLGNGTALFSMELKIPIA